MVVITNQSFRDAGGSESFPNLSIGNIVYGNRILETEKGRVGAMARADISLEAEANKYNLTHVFNVRHALERDGHPVNNNYWCFAYGTGYRELEKK